MDGRELHNFGSGTDQEKLLFTGDGGRSLTGSPFAWEISSHW